MWFRLEQEPGCNLFFKYVGIDLIDHTVHVGVRDRDNHDGQCWNAPNIAVALVVKNMLIAPELRGKGFCDGLRGDNGFGLAVRFQNKKSKLAAIVDAKELVGDRLTLPSGYRLQWTGQYELMEEMQERMAKIGAEPMLMTPQEFDAYIRKEIGTNAILVKAAGITVN